MSNGVIATDQFCIADPLIESSYGMLAFPWLTKDGTALVLTYHDGKDNSGGSQNNKTRLKKSYDNGVTWTTGQIVWDDSLDSGAQIVILSNGDYLMVSQVYINNVPGGLYTKRSLDKGATWDVSVAVTNAAGYGFTSSAPLEVSPGVLLWPVYGASGGPNTSKLMVSLDYGLTWALGPVVCPSPDGVIETNETVLQKFSDGTLWAVTRCGDFNARLNTSVDNGSTWSASAILFGNCESRIDWIRLGSGRCIFTYRDHVSGSEMLSYSDNNMMTCSVPVQIHGPDKRTSYTGLIEVQTGQALAVIGEIDDTEANGRLMGRYVVSTGTITPSGQVTYQTSLEYALGKDSVLAWDSFKRPDNAQGLGSADSGHKWLEYGGNTSNNWKIVSGSAVNSVASIKPITIDTKNAWGSVETTIKWAGGTTSSPLGLVAKRSTITGHALLGKLDNNGHIARISYWNNGTITDLAATSATLHYSPDTWYKFKLIVKPDLIVFTIDGREVLSYTMTSTDHTNLDAGTQWGLLGGGSSSVNYFARSFIVRDC